MKSLKLIVVFIGLSFGGMAYANPPIHDCTSACVVVTCDATQCNVYHCVGGVCTPIGSFPRHDDQVNSAPSDDGLAAAFKPTQVTGAEVLVCEDPSGCAVVTCVDTECQVVGFHDGKAITLGTVEGFCKTAEAMLRLFQAENLLDASISER
ncbi:MAG: hypothetical protein ACXIUM_07690 [Wenzhouxiangella sp.]